MLPTTSLEKYLEHTPGELRDIVLELRNIIVAVAPNSTEVLHRYGITYYNAERGGPVSAGVCQILICQDHVRLAFIHGAFLPDPRGLLQGDRIAKRYVRIYSYEQAPWDYLRDLIIASSHFDPYSLVSH